MAKHKKKKKSKVKQNAYKRVPKKAENKVKEEKKEEQEKQIYQEVLTENQEITENTENKKNQKNNTEFLKSTFCNIYQLWDRFSKFVTETRKVSVPVIIAVYTVVIVSAALIIDNSYNKRRLEVEEARLIEEISNARAHSADIVLQKDVSFAAGEKCIVTYGGFSFSDKVTAQNAEKYSACYENTSESNIYIDVIIDYENTNDSEIRADLASVMTINDGKKDYPCFSAAETDGGKNIEFSSGQTIPPGSKVRLHHIFDVPKELEKDGSPLTAKVVIDNVGYVINLRE